MIGSKFYLISLPAIYNWKCWDLSVHMGMHGSESIINEADLFNFMHAIEATKPVSEIYHKFKMAVITGIRY